MKCARNRRIIIVTDVVVVVVAAAACCCYNGDQKNHRTKRGVYSTYLRMALTKNMTWRVVRVYMDGIMIKCVTLLKLQRRKDNEVW